MTFSLLSVLSKKASASRFKSLQGGARPGTRGSALGHSFSTHAKAVNGTGVIAKDWVRVIEGLTMRNDLRFLTMLPWANALTCRHLLRPTRAWCPCCYGEWRANEQIVYDPLLWAFSEVQVCLRHQRRLRFQCHHCARNLPWLRRRTLPGHCSKCGRSEEHTSELQSRPHLVCRLLLEKKKTKRCSFLVCKKKKEDRREK